MTIDLSFIEKDWNNIMEEIGVTFTRKRPTFTTDDMGRVTDISYSEATIRGWVRPLHEDDFRLIKQGFDVSKDYVGLFWADDIQVGDIVIYNGKELEIIDIVSTLPVGGGKYISRVRLT